MRDVTGLQDSWTPFVTNAVEPGRMIEGGWLRPRATRPYHRFFACRRAPEPVALVWNMNATGEITFLRLGTMSDITRRLASLVGPPG